MIRLTSKNITTIAAAFIGGALILSCLAASPARQEFLGALPYNVKLGNVSLQSGDQISIEEVRGTSDTLSAGNTYEVKGTYKLASCDQAVLAINVTVDVNAARSLSGESHPPLAEQKITVEKGEGRFTLRFHMWRDGNPHVSFYPAKGGESFASTYF